MRLSEKLAIGVLAAFVALKLFGQRQDTQRNLHVDIDGHVKIPTLTPSVQPQAIPADMFVYKTDEKGRRNLYTEDPRAARFINEWIVAALENMKSAPAIKASSPAATPPTYADWQNRHQLAYLARLKNLIEKMTPECRYDFNKCPKDNPQKKRVQKLQRENVASDALRCAYGSYRRLSQPLLVL